MLFLLLLCVVFAVVVLCLLLWCCEFAVVVLCLLLWCCEFAVLVLCLLSFAVPHLPGSRFLHPPNSTPPHTTPPPPSSTSQKTFRRFPTKSDTTGMAACAGWILTVASVLSMVTHVLHVFFPSLLKSPWASITTLPRPSGAAANRSGVHDNDPTVSADVSDTENCVVQGEVV